MSSTFQLRLDTHAPSVVWGGSSGTTAGELLKVQYVSDEPLASAVLVLADARRLALTVLPDHVEVLLPPDAPDGPASIEVADNVANTRIYAAVVQISGTALPPPPVVVPASPGFPGSRRGTRTSPTPSRETRVWTSTTGISSTSSVAFTATSEVTSAVSTTTASSSSTRTISAPSQVGTAVSSALRADVTSDSGRRLEREAVVRRRDSPDTEALLLLL